VAPALGTTVQLDSSCRQAAKSGRPSAACRDCLDLNLALRQSPFDRGIENREVSAIVADAVVDTVVLLPYRAVERRRTRRRRDRDRLPPRLLENSSVLPRRHTLSGACL
jgi:hypothetical protein